MDMDLTALLMNNASTFLFVFVRTGAILLAAPIFGAFNVPMQVKLGLSLVIALIITPLAGHAAMPQSFLSLVLSMGGELMVGLAIGMCVRFIFTGIEYAGQLSSLQMGIGMSSIYDPSSGAQVLVFGKLMSILTLLVFLSVNGHLMIIMALKKSFEVIPPYGFHMTPRFMDGFISMSREIFILGVKFSAPIIAVLFFVNLGLGLLSRVVPQINMFAIGFAITIVAGLVVFDLSMPVFGPAMARAFDGMWEGISDLIKVM